MEKRADGRFCERCERVVHDTTRMHRSELNELLRSHRGQRLCLRVCQLEDGSVVTKDHPRAPGSQRIGQRSLAALLGFLGLAACGSADRGADPEEARSSEPADEVAIELTQEELDLLALLGYGWDSSPDE